MYKLTAYALMIKSLTKGKQMNTKAKELNTELQNDGFKHLFYVEPGKHPEEKNIGRNCKYINPTCGVEHEMFTIGSLQFDYAGRLCYRVYFEGDTFGRVAQINEIEIL